jgi:microcystin-dependent protein
MRIDTKLFILLFSLFIIIVLINYFNKKRDNKDNYLIKTTENFTSNVLYTDFNGNIGTSSDIGVSSINVSDNADINGILDSVKIKQAGNILIPTGIIMMWSGFLNTIPPGWSLCDGRIVNGVQTPDLRNKFIAGAGDSYSVGTNDGKDTVTLSIDQLPTHNHTAKDSGHAHTYSDRCSGSPSDARKWNGTDFTERDEAKTTEIGIANITVGYTGGSQPHENRPPFYALYYIMKS